MRDKMKYEPPRLIEFGDHIEQSKGECYNGSGDAGDCDANGTSAGGGCWDTGISASFECLDGVSHF